MGNRVCAICLDWNSMPSLPQSVSVGRASLRRLRSLAPWAIQDSSKYLVRTKKFAIKEHIQCKFEGFGSSERCRCEDYRQQKGESAIVGLHSSWVTEHILATARPSDAVMKDHSVIPQFQSGGIGAIFNLQEPGEHGDCGPGIKPESGFSYTPELLMKNNIFYYNFPWRDMTCPKVDYTFNIVAVMDSHISRGVKVAVHCHSGLGRTGLVIACYLVYRGPYDAVAAVELVRKHRPGALQTKQQVLHVKEFEDYLAGLKIVFVQPWQSLDRSGTKIRTFEVLMSRQRQILHGEEGRALRYTPKILVNVLRELTKRLIIDKDNKQKISAAFLQGLTNVLKTDTDKDFTSSLQAAKQALNVGNWDIVYRLDNQILVQLVLDWLHLLQEPIIPDAVLTRALSRGEINGANSELKRGGKCCFYTVRLLACWLLQISPVEKNPRRRLFSGLAHILLHPSNLPSIRKIDSYVDRSEHSSDDELYRKRKLRRSSTFNPTLLEVEFGLLLEAAAKYWSKVAIVERKLSQLGHKSPCRSREEISDKAGVELEICTISEAVEEEEDDDNDDDENFRVECDPELLSAACVEELLTEITSRFIVLPSPTSSPRSSPRSSAPSTSTPMSTSRSAEPAI